MATATAAGLRDPAAPRHNDHRLSAPFSQGLAAAQLFSPERAAEQLLDVLEKRQPEQSGAFLAWDGQTIPW